MSFFETVELYSEHYPVKHHLTLDHFMLGRLVDADTAEVELLFGSDGDKPKQVLYKDGLLADSFGETISKGRVTHRAQSIMTVINGRYGAQIYTPVDVGGLVASLFFQWDQNREHYLTHSLQAKVIRDLMGDPGVGTAWTLDRILHVVHNAHRETIVHISNDYPVSVLLLGFNQNSDVVAAPITR
jgi:hypothetical protein